MGGCARTVSAVYGWRADAILKTSRISDCNNFEAAAEELADEGIIEIERHYIIGDAFL